ncbi:MAG TPA: adenylate/guanylate cyclase domain-containing protein [Candidatus Binataceae bacterium]|nr:adenylate/guanylate cyclase domain-containing protein [Candidatus Binataceae bacterium]
MNSTLAVPVAHDDTHPPRFAASAAVAVTVTVTNAGSALDGERKTVTALFADIKGSTELMEDLDPEEAQALIDPALNLMIESVRHFDGYIVQSTGDGIFALFGAPVAREDHPQRALHAALRMQEEMRTYGARLRAEGRSPIEIRVGVNTGEVVVRSIQTGARASEYTPIGHTTNLAARLQTIASTGSIVISDATERLVAGYFTLKPLGPVKVRGVSDPIEVFEVAGVGPLRTRLQASAMRGLSKFVGRGREIEKLLTAFEAVKRGRGQLVSAVADAGVGKSRLFHEFKAIAGSSAMTLEASSVSHGKAAAYLPVIDLLNDYFAIAAEDDRRRRREKIGGKILMLDRALEDTLPFLTALLGVEADQGPAARNGEDSLVGIDAHTRRRQTLAAIERILLRESQNQPLILVFEDLHWVDSATQGLLDLMAESVAGARIMMLVNYRPEYQPRWTNQSNFTELRLEPLGLAGASQMLDALLDGGEVVGKASANGGGANRATAAELKRFIIEKTDGNPFFIEEMVRTLFERGALRHNGGLEITLPLDHIRIPPTVNGILAARIDRLAADNKELLQTLAVIGKEFTPSLVRRVAPQEFGQRLEAMLADLQGADFIYEEPQAGESTYYFKHALTQEVAYNSVLSERRKLLHERAGAAMEKLYAQRLDDCLAAVAHHYGRSGNVPKALEYLNRAGAQAAHRTAYREAVERLSQGIALLLTLPATPDRDRQELTMQSALGQYLVPLKGVAAGEVRVALERARDLAVDYGTEGDIFWLVYGIQFHHLVRLELITARALGERQLAIAERSGDLAMRMAAYVALAQTMLLTGEFESARDLCDRAMTLPRELPDFPPGGSPVEHPREISRLSDITDTRPLILSVSASVLATTGYPDQAVRRSAEAVAMARLSGPHSLIVAINSAAELRFRLADWDSVIELAAELEALAVQRELPVWRAYAITLRGQALAHLGRAQEGLELIKQGGSQFETTPAVGRQWRIHYVDALGRLGRVDEALALLTDVETGLKEAGWGVAAAELHRIRGELLVVRGSTGDLAAAEASFRDAIGVARRQHARLFELRGANALAGLLDAAGRRDEAHAMLAEIYGQFTEGFEARDLKEARAILDRLARQATQ